MRILREQMRNNRQIHKVSLILILVVCIGSAASAKPTPVPDSILYKTYSIGDASIRMRYVRGGIFTMGSTVEQHDPDVYSDKPAHARWVEDYYIMTTEVTNSLWRTVMGSYPVPEAVNNARDPVSHISWEDCQVFIQKLDSLTGLEFRLPTESEWEYAARGEGGKDYRYAGSDEIDSVGWIFANSGAQKHPVAQKLPNRIGLYDMTGNVGEWCQDKYKGYTAGGDIQSDEEDQSGEYVVRGASFDNCEANSHLSMRFHYEPYQVLSFVGFRLAMSVPKATTQEEEIERPLMRKIKIGIKRFILRYVPTARPYYISEEDITYRQWNKIMNQDREGKSTEPITQVSIAERRAFIERCRQLSKEPIELATAEDIRLADSLGVIKVIPTKPMQVKSWEKDAQSIQRHRKRIKRASPWAALIGLRLQMPDDPILQMLDDGNPSGLPLRMVIRCR